MSARALFWIPLPAILAGCAAPYPEEPTYRPHALEAPAPLPSPDPVVSPEEAAAGRPSTVEAPLSLEECVQTALARSRRVGIADREVLIASDRVNEVMTDLLPKVGAEGRYETRSSAQGAKFQGQEFTMGDREVGTIRVGAIVPIYTFGAVSNRREAAELRGDVAALDAERVRQNLELLVRLSYFRILEAEKIRGVVADSIAVLERQLTISRDFYAQGLVARNDVLANEVQLANRRQELIQAENNAQLATATLNRLLALDVNRPTRVVDVLEVRPWTGSLESVIETAVENRPDLAAFKKEIDVARADFRVTRSALLPILSGYADYYHSTNEFLLDQDWLQAGVVLQVPLFDGLTTLTRLSRNRREIENAVDRHDEQVDDVLLEVKRAFLDVREASERVPVARKSIEQAEENLRMTGDQYREGLLSSADVLTEEDRLSGTRSNYYRALYDYHSAFARLKNVLGEEPPRGVPPPAGNR